MNTYAYVSNAASGDIAVLRLHEGALTLVQRVDCGGCVMPMALAPGARRLYAARRAEPFALLSFAIDAASGELGLLGMAPLPESLPCIACDRSGRWLFGASYHGHVVTVGAIGEGGVAEAPHQVLATPPKAHAIGASPDNRHVCATSLGGDRLLCWRFDAEQGLLDPASLVETALHAGSGPRHFVWDSSGRHLYLLCELDASVVVFDCDESGLVQRQIASALPPGFEGEPWAADLHLSTDGRRLVVSERRSSTLAVFDVDAASGTLAPRGSVATEANPRGFAIDPSGRWLIAAGQDSGAVRLHDLDAGALVPVQTLAVGDGPNWVEIVRLP